VDALRDSTGRIVDRPSRFPAWTVRGGSAVLSDSASGNVVGAYTRHGLGHVACLGISSSFADGRMGGNQSVVPDSLLRRHFQVEFDLIRGLVERR
jgi:hypothetical protein